MEKYYEFKNGCGTGSTTIAIKVITDNEENESMELLVACWWMSESKYSFKITGNVLKVDGLYNVIRFENFHDLTSEEQYECRVFFDCFKFENPLKTEWCSHPIDDLPIGLYMGNSCYSIENFSLFMARNKSILDDLDKYKILEKVVNTISNCKFEETNEENFKSVLEHITKNTHKYCKSILKDKS